MSSIVVRNLSAQLVELVRDRILSGATAADPITTKFLERLHILSGRYVRKHLEPLGRDKRANQEYRQLLHAGLARNGDLLAGLLSKHISQTLDDLRRQLPAQR